MRTLTITEAADRLRVTRWTVYRHLELVDIDGTWHVDEDTILRLLADNTVHPTTKENTPVNGIPRLYTLEEVAEKNPHLTARALADGARAGKFEHIRFGRRRLMTEAQIAKLLEDNTERSRADAEVAQEDADLAKVAARRARRGRAA